MDNTKDTMQYEEMDPPQLPKKPYVPEQKPVIAVMKKYRIKVPLVYPSYEEENTDDWTE